MSDNAALSDVPNEAAYEQTVLTEDLEPVLAALSIGERGYVKKTGCARWGERHEGDKARARKPYLILILIPSSN